MRVPSHRLKVKLFSDETSMTLLTQIKMITGIKKVIMQFCELCAKLCALCG
jgi:hypothetical protein